MVSRSVGWVVLAAALAGCGGGGGSGSPAAATAAGATGSGPGLAGSWAEAPRGTSVHLVDRRGAERSVRGLAAAVLGSEELDAEGRFRLVPLPAPAQGPLELLVLAPGRALCFLEVAPGQAEVAAPSLDPEAVLEVRVRVDGAPAAEALGLVLDAQGTPLPLPPLELVANAAGLLRARSLPAGALLLLVASSDGTRHARLELVVARGERRAVEVTLVEDAATERRFLEAFGGPGASLAALSESAGGSAGEATGPAPAEREEAR